MGTNVCLFLDKTYFLLFSVNYSSNSESMGVFRFGRLPWWRHPVETLPALLAFSEGNQFHRWIPLTKYQ